MDIAFDTSGFSACVRSPELLRAVIVRIETFRSRLALPLQALYEVIDDVDLRGVARRLTSVVTLSEGLGRRFFFTQDIGDLLQVERRRAISSIPRVPDDFQDRLIDRLRLRDVSADLPEVRAAIQAQQRKDETHRRDRDARRALSQQFAHLGATLNADLDNMPYDDGFWRLVFVENASDGFRYRSRMRLYPRRYSTAVMLAAYGTLIAFGAIFADTGFGHHAGILTAPKRNDWIDQLIAATAAHAKVLLTEDGGQRNKVNFVAQRFGLRVRAVTVDAWLGGP